MKKFHFKPKQTSKDITYPNVTRINRELIQEEASTSNLTDLYSEISTNLISILDENINSNSINSSNNSIVEMADALRSTVSLLKPFDGTPSRLESFINQIDTFHTRYFNADPSQQEFVLLAIKSKIINNAEDFILTRSDLVTWAEIKNVLQQKFSDPITRANLQQQLIFLTKKNESTQDYIQKLKALVTKINTKICTEVTNAEARAILISQNELTATQNLLANISSELRTLLIVQNPQNLNTAIDIITNYEILTSQATFKNNYLQNQNKSNKPVNQIVSNFQRPFTPQVQRPQNQFFSNQRNQNQFFPNQRNQNHQFPNQFKKSQFRPQNQQPNTPNQKITPKQTFPQPMSGVSTIKQNSIQTRPQYQNRPQSYFQQTGRPNFISQELTHIEKENNNDFDYQSESNYYPNEDYNPEFENTEDYPSTSSMLPCEESLSEQLQNFQLQASE